MSNAKSPRRSIWTTFGGSNYADLHKKFQEIIDKKEPQGQPKLITSPKFPATPPVKPPVKEDATGKPITSSSQDDTKFLTLPPEHIKSFAQTLKTHNTYPQMEGPFETVKATPQELESVTTFMQTFDFWVILARLFFKTNFYKTEWESKNKYDIVFMQLDPILISAVGSPIYAHFTEIGIPSISGCNLDKFKVEVQGERSTQPSEKIFNKHRRDREYQISTQFSCPSIDGNASYLMTNNNQQPDPNAEKGTFKFVLEELKANIELILVKIDDAFETEEIRYRPPKISLKYNLKDAKIIMDKAPPSSPIPIKDIERLFNEYKVREIIGNKDQVAQRLVDIYDMRLTPLIVQLRWIHQLHDIMYFTMVNEPDKIIPEFSKIQTRLVEVVFFALTHTKIRELIFAALKQQSYEPFKKLVFFRECPELRTAKKVNTLVSKSNKKEKEDIRDDANDIIETEKSTQPKKFKRIITLQYYIMRFFAQSILI